MRKEWQAMQVQVVGQVADVVQGNRGKYSPPVDDLGAEAFRQKEQL